MAGLTFRTLSIRWGGVGCRVAFFIAIGILLDMLLAGSVLFGGRENLINMSFQRGMIILAGTAVIILVFSHIIASGIIKPLTNLNVAIEQLVAQNWRKPIPVRGRDELSRLIAAVNRMAETLNQREASLSRGNRDLFILHTAGLNLMESLDLDVLLRKITARASDLVKAETTTVSSVNRSSRMLQYLAVEGGKARVLKDLDLPLESGGIFNWLASYGTPILIQDAQTDFRLDNDFMKSRNITSLMSVPLWSSNSMIAVLTVVNKKGGEVFDKQDLRMFTVFASLVGAALQNAFLYADLKEKMQELNAAQQQLIHSTKLAAVGELATNIAHEINNPLTSVLGYTSHLLKSLDIPDESREKLCLMEQETLRVRKIIRNLLDFSRQRPPNMQIGDLLYPLRETVALLKGVAEQSGVHISESYPPGQVSVRMDPNELKQVFINIMNNAFHAMPGGGDLSIRIRRTNEEPDQAVVEIADTGHGIARENLGKIFEPFFSTKNAGDGTGLGLSISHRIILNHRGRIEVRSEEGKGACFCLFFPIEEAIAVTR